MTSPVDDGGNTQVDFVWGNVPMQNNDARGGDTLNYALDNHVIVQVGWNGYPGFEPNDPGNTDYVSTPNIVGDLAAAAIIALGAVGLTLGTTTTTWVGATTVNTLKIKTQSPAAAASFDPVIGGPSYVNVVTYLAPTVPSVLGLVEADANTALVAAHVTKGAVTTDYVGATVANNLKVKTQTPASATQVNTDATVALVTYAAPTVPDVTGVVEATASSDLVSAHLLLGTVTTTWVGATTVNTLEVKSQTPAAAALANTGSTVDVVKYLAPSVPNVLAMTEAVATSTLIAAHVTKGAVTTTTAGCAAAISNVARSGTTVTVTTGAAHGFVPGQTCTTTAVSNTGINGAFVLTSASGDTYVYTDTNTGTIVSGADTGTAVITALIGEVKSQTPASATQVNTDATVALVLYAAA